MLRECQSRHLQESFEGGSSLSPIFKFRVIYSALGTVASPSIWWRTPLPPLPHLSLPLPWGVRRGLRPHGASGRNPGSEGVSFVSWAVLPVVSLRQASSRAHQPWCRWQPERRDPVAQCPAGCGLLPGEWAPPFPSPHRVSGPVVWTKSRATMASSSLPPGYP